MNTSIGSFKSNSDGELRIEFSLKNGEQIVFNSIPVGAEFWVREESSAYKSSYVLYYSYDLDNVIGSDSNTVPYRSITANCEIEESYPITVVFNNQKVARDVKLSNKVEIVPQGSLAADEYLNKQFKYTIELYDLEKSSYYYTAETDADITGNSTNRRWKSDSNGNLTIQYNLVDGKSITIKNLPLNAEYNITVAAEDGYTPSYFVQSNDGAVILRSEDSSAKGHSLSTATEKVDNTDLDVEFIFTNTYNPAALQLYVLPNSGMENMIPRIVKTIILFVLFAVIFIYSSNKKERLEKV